MQTAALLLFLLWACPLVAQIRYDLDLSQTTLDSTIWTINSPNSESAAMATFKLNQNENLTLTNNEWLLLKTPLQTTKATIKGSFSINDREEILRLTVQTSAARTGGMEIPAEGVSLELSQQKATLVLGGKSPVSLPPVKLSQTLALEMIHRFEVTDDGSSLSLSLNGSHLFTKNYRDHPSFIDGGANVLLTNRKGSQKSPHHLKIYSYSISSPEFKPSRFTLYGLDHQTDELVRINTESGTVSPLGPLGIDVSAFTGLDYDPKRGLLITSVLGISDTVLYQINTETGVATVFKRVPKTNDADIEQFGFAKDGTMYAWDEGPAFTKGSLWKVDLDNLTSTKLGNSTLPNVLGGDYQEGSGFWVSDEWNGRLYRLYENTARIDLTGPVIWHTGNGPGDLWDMDFGLDGTLRVAASDGAFPGSVLLSINQQDGSESSRVNLSRDIRAISSVPILSSPIDTPRFNR